MKNIKSYKLLIINGLRYIIPYYLLYLEKAGKNFIILFVIYLLLIH